MSVHINSEDFTTGSKSNGTWSLSQKIKGYYQVSTQYIDAENIPWITSDYTWLTMTYDGETTDLKMIDDDDVAVVSLSEDLDAIALYLETFINSEAARVFWDWTVSIVANEAKQTLTLTFDKPVTINYGTGNMNSDSIFSYGSTDESGTTFIWSTVNIDIHPHLYVQVAESSTKINEVDTINASFIFHTDGNPLTNMYVHFPSSTKTLTISFYRKSTINDITPLINKWDLILVPV